MLGRPENLSNNSNILLDGNISASSHPSARAKQGCVWQPKETALDVGRRARGVPVFLLEHHLKGFLLCIIFGELSSVTRSVKRWARGHILEKLVQLRVAAAEGHEARDRKRKRLPRRRLQDREVEFDHAFDHSDYLGAARQRHCRRFPCVRPRRALSGSCLTQSI